MRGRGLSSQSVQKTFENIEEIIRENIIGFGTGFLF